MVVGGAVIVQLIPLTQWPELDGVTWPQWALVVAIIILLLDRLFGSKAGEFIRQIRSEHVEIVKDQREFEQEKTKDQSKYALQQQLQATSSIYWQQEQVTQGWASSQEAAEEANNFIRNKVYEKLEDIARQDATHKAEITGELKRTTLELRHVATDIKLIAYELTSAAEDRKREYRQGLDELHNRVAELEQRHRGGTTP